MDAADLLTKLVFDVAASAIGTVIAARARGWKWRRMWTRGGSMN